MKLKVSIAAIIQARMSSTRFPGKVMSNLLNKSMLEFQIERIRKCEDIDEIIIATTKNNSDDIICEMADKLSIKVFRGDEKDVLSRYVEASKLSEADILVRLTADCPLVDPIIIEEVINLYKLNNVVEYCV